MAPLTAMEETGRPVLKKSRSLSILLFLNAIVGHAFAARLLSVRCDGSCKFFLFCAAFAFGNFIMFAYGGFVTLHIVQSARELDSEHTVSSFAFTIASSFGIFLGLFRVLCMTLQRSQLFELFRFPLKSDFVDRSMVSRAAKWCLLLVALNTFVYFSFVLTSAVLTLNMTGVLFNGSSTYIFNATSDKTWLYMERSPHYQTMMTNLTSASFVVWILAVYTVAMTLTFKYILADTYDYFCYLVAVAMFEKTSKSVSAAIDSGHPEKIQQWLEHHWQSISYLKRVNKTTSACVTASIVFNTAQACVIDYVAASGLLEPTHSFVLFALSTLSLMHIFIYCYFGHRIKALTAGVNASAYKSQWISGSEVSRKAAVMVATVTSNSDYLVQVGGPFFSLSMEFFISILGAITTYFLILLQFK